MFGGNGVESSQNTATTACPSPSDTTGDTIGDGVSSVWHVIGGILSIGFCLARPAGLLEEDTTRTSSSNIIEPFTDIVLQRYLTQEYTQLGSYNDELSTRLPCPQHAGTMWNSRES
jgi:hypothetical protein